MSGKGTCRSIPPSVPLLLLLLVIDNPRTLCARGKVVSGWKEGKWKTGSKGGTESEAMVWGSFKFHAHHHQWPTAPID